MKATIVRPDGTRIEAEGTPEEIVKLAGAPATVVQYVYLPCTQQHYQYQQYPYQQPYIWYGGAYGNIGQMRLSGNMGLNTNAAACFQTSGYVQATDV